MCVCVCVCIYVFVCGLNHCTEFVPRSVLSDAILHRSIFS